MKAAILALLAALCGLAWGHDGLQWLVIVASLMPVLWAAAPDRRSAGLAALLYYLASSRGLPGGSGVFFYQAPAWYGYGLWLAAALANALPWWLLWSVNHARKAWLGLVCLVVTTVPPLGIIGWTNPLTASGWFFPGLGFAAITLHAALLWASIGHHRKAVAGLLMVAAGANVVAPSVAAPAGWIGHDTHFGRLGSDNQDFLAAFNRLLDVESVAMSARPGQVIVLPETILGRVIPMTEDRLSSVSIDLKRKGAVVVVGGELTGRGKQSRNALMVLGEGEHQALIQRVPVPVSMWKPWANDGTEASLFGSGVGRVGGRKVAYLICYEQLLTFPVLASLARRPDVMVAASNLWWARTTNIPAIQDQALRAWSRAFSVPIVRAVNV